MPNIVYLHSSYPKKRLWRSFVLSALYSSVHTDGIEGMNLVIGEFLYSLSSYLFISLENVVLAERTCCIHLKPFHNACRMEMMVAG